MPEQNTSSNVTVTPGPAVHPLLRGRGLEQATIDGWKKLHSRILLVPIGGVPFVLRPLRRNEMKNLTKEGENLTVNDMQERMVRKALLFPELDEVWLRNESEAFTIQNLYDRLVALSGGETDEPPILL